ncbi:unnamed protein product [Dibothriocephalus latus]|uniref:Uncharacterized protein n=1 Tax=Dibothriocephalus latus TaxID=60516 RepID=A0A3P6S174_DIBLA|nr:unnamed protein product [Dibothriocephalus latus]
MKFKWRSVFEQLLFTFIVRGGRTRAYSGETALAYPQNNVNMFILISDHRVTQLMTLLYDLGYIVFRATFRSYSIIIGPQSGSNCDLVTDWIRISSIAAVDSDRIFQINIACHMFVFQMEFIVPNALRKQQDVLLTSQMPSFMLVSIPLPTELTSIVHALGNFLKQETVEGKERVVTPRRLYSNHFAAISLVLTTSDLITGINTLLSYYGWQMMTVFHEVSLEGGESAFLAHQIVLTLIVGGASTGPFKAVRRQGLRQGMNHAELLADK